MTEADHDSVRAQIRAGTLARAWEIDVLEGIDHEDGPMDVEHITKADGKITFTVTLSDGTTTTVTYDENALVPMYHRSGW